jgi:GNAT superfamily N-acetyltransferase
VGSRRALIIVAVAAALVACGGGSSSPPPGAALDRVLATLEDFQRRGCACADATCFQAVQTEMETWAKANARDVAGSKATRAQAARATAIDRAMVECQERFGVVTEDYKRADQLVAELREYKQRYCACTTPECVAAIDQKMKLWATARAEMIKQLKPTRRQDEAAARVEAEIKACITRIGPAAKAPEAPAPP